MNRHILFAVVGLLLWNCNGKKAPNHFSDTSLRKIANYQDRRLSDSLYEYLQSSDARYRSAAALAFASIQDTSAAAVLGNLLLEDTSAQVRSCAAFALGQTGGVAAVNALIPAAEDRQPSVAREVLEALGKTVDVHDIDVLKNHAATDSLTEEGLAWGYYRLALRNKTDTQIVVRQNDFLLPSHSLQTRLAAAHFFNQSSVLGGTFEKNLIQAALQDRSPEVRIAATAGLRKLKNDEALVALREVLEKEQDYRVRISAVRSLQSFPLESTWDLFVVALHDNRDNVAIAASEVLQTLLRTVDDKLVGQARTAKNVRVQANLFRALFAAGPYTDVQVEEVKQKYAAASNDYQKAQWLTALSSVTGTWHFIAEELLNTNATVVRTSAALALADINHHKDFSNVSKKEIAEYYRKAIVAGDAAVIAIITETLSDPVLGYRKVITDFSFLKEAEKKLKLPKDIESLQPLENAIAYFEGKERPAPLKNTYNHPIYWTLASTIDRDQEVLVKTTRGDIVLRLLVEEAPGSVSNFVALIRQKYFDGRYFHRVVPNFVVQTGCNRGDGFGSEEYSIRSEFSRRRYATGSVGMASAGKDTEGTQWFITHSPTPHLGGRYTIFAQVEEGMDVVDGIEVGDRITNVSLVTNP